MTTLAWIGTYDFGGVGIEKHGSNLSRETISAVSKCFGSERSSFSRGDGSAMAKDPTKEPAFQKTLANLLKMKPKPHSEMKVGKKKVKTTSKSRRRAASKAD
jgi:hypothetical protein